MNRAEVLKKNEGIRAFFQLQFAGKIRDVNQARKRMQAKFGLSDQKWYQMRPQFVRMMRIPEEGKEDLTMETTSSPPTQAGTPAETAQLLTMTQEQDARIAYQSLQLSQLKADLERQERRNKLLAKIVTDCLSNL